MEKRGCYSQPLPTLVDTGPGGTDVGQRPLTEPSPLGQKRRRRKNRGLGPA